jgi:tetratricopeptide (TPR) repeat protein
MKQIVILLLFFFGFLGNAGTQQIKNPVDKAEKLMLVNPKSAFQIAEKAYQNSPDRKTKLRLLFVMTNTSSMLQNPLNVIRYGNEALSVANDNDVVTKIKILGILGNTYQAIKLNEKTRIYLDKAELLLSSPKIPDSLSYIKGNIYYLKAMNYFNSLDSDIALSYFDKAINQYLSSKHPYAELNLKLAYLNRAFTLIEQKNLSQALESLKLAGINTRETSQIYPPQFVDLQSEFIELAKAKIYSVQKNTDLSNGILLKMLERRKNSPVRDDIENDVYKILSDNYLITKDIKQHDYYQELYLKRLAQTNKDAAVWVNKLMTQEKLHSKIESDRIRSKYVYSIVLSLVIFLSLFIYLLMRQVRIRTKRSLLEKKVLDHL